MKTIFSVILAMMTLVTLSTAHAADPMSTIRNETTGQCLTKTTPLTMTDCDLSPSQNFDFMYSGDIRNGNCLNGSYTSDGTVGAPVSMGRCSSLTSHWWRPRGSKHIYMSSAGDQDCLQQVGSTIELHQCGIFEPNMNWVLDSAIPADWPFTGLVQPYNRGLNSCLEAPGAFTNADYKAGSPLAVGDCSHFMKGNFLFTASGTINVYGYCATADESTGRVLYKNCDNTESQQWTRQGSKIVSKQGLCIGAAGDPPVYGALAQLQTCTNNLFQEWELPGLSENWPPPASTPSTAVVGSTLTKYQVNSVVDWIQAETSISTTPFCYKTASYDRGIGIEANCANDQEKNGLVCYPRCASGYKGVGPVCWTTQSLTYNPGSHCIQWAPKLLGGFCVATAMNSCRDGYHGDKIATCYIDKASYGRGAGSLPTSCNSNRNYEDLLCYLKPRAGYDCLLTTCTQNCPAGTHECGLSACASSAQNCASSIVDMVVSPLEVLANIGTGGAAGAATTAVKVASAALKVATLASDIYTAEEALRQATGDFMTVAEANLGDMSTNAVEAAVANGYGRGSANYKFIAREWAARMLLLTIIELEKSIDTILITTMDPTGIAATANAFAKPPCAQHTTMPQY
jgi:hypothetical protein